MRLRILSLVAFLGLTAGVAAADISAEAEYVVNVGGLNVAGVSVTLTDDGDNYALKLKADVTGMGTMIASGSASINSTGRATSPALSAEKFGLITKANGETFSVSVGYAGGAVTSFIVDPPIVDNYGRIPIERSHLTGVGDILASFVFKGGALDASLCKRKFGIFTGVERFNMAMSFISEDQATSARTGYQGPVILCNMRYTPVSGHYEGSEMTDYLAAADRILIWYAPLGDTGYFIPYRLLAPTAIGDLSMVLTGMTY
ncbi:MAG: hypothetical protein JWR75_2126 [Devosia sp.]|nr:hypothetical protein [Devosia sp.]